MAQQVKIDPDAVRALAELLRETDLTEIEYQIDSLRIKVLRSVTQAVVPVSVPAAGVSVVSGDVMAAGAAASTGASVTAAVSSSSSSSQAGFDAVPLEKHPGVVEAQMVGTVYLSPGPDAAPFVSIGDSVKEGQTLFIIEAMKVMNMIKSPRSGIVKHIFVKDAQPVEYGDPIIIVE